ncbi:MAG: AMP-binding protein, partial [Chloroflexales bacterium]|nr:AMP-binding protein [Chloroflexales bacterium]
MEERHTSILAALLAHAESDPTRPCLIWHDAAYTYSDLAAAASDWAGSYAALGVGHGDRVGLYLSSGPTFLAAYLGAHAAGAAAVLINTQYRQVELRHILADSEPRVVVADAEGHAQLAELGHSDTSVLQVDPSQIGAPDVGGGSLRLPQAGDLAILAYTSGTTGRAKGAMLTHGCLAANSAAVGAAWRWTAADRLLLALPLFHIHGLGVGVHGTLTAGASL